MDTRTRKFIEKAVVVHGNSYDYSKVVYVSSNKKICITCRQHGDFWQTPDAHVNYVQNCPKCSAIAGGQKRKGDNNTMKKESTKLKSQQTCLVRYGTKTWAEHPDHRKIQRDIVLNSDMLDRMRATCQKRYGANMWTQSAEGRARLSEIMSSEAMLEHVRNGYLFKYGVEHYMKTEEAKRKMRAYMSDADRKMQLGNAMLSKYGVRWAAQVPGVARAGWRTKRADGTYNHSNPESTLYLLLCDVFGEYDVEWEYASDERYPYSCDFYIKSMDLFIELNAHWTHGGHWFDPLNPHDLDVVLCWKNKHSVYYDVAINVWTVRDVAKREMAVKNNLNYLVFWNSNLNDVKHWLKSFQ